MNRKRKVVLGIVLATAVVAVLILALPATGEACWHGGYGPFCFWR